jgi:hypothetical protein
MYLITNNKKDFDKLNIYDTYSLIALGVMEVALAGAIYFLLVDK